jgi:hypothetical protein
VLLALVVASAAAFLAARPTSAGMPDMGELDALAAGKTKKQCSSVVGESSVDEAEELGLSGVARATTSSGERWRRGSRGTGSSATRLKGPCDA